ncbi:MAG: hypothetical protein HFE97_05415 [Oscillospiraceae bacterium]|nr:hypothetical protein [Oscillospiraceae bacterium]
MIPYAVAEGWRLYDSEAYPQQLKPAQHKLDKPIGSKQIKENTEETAHKRKKHVKEP